MRSVKALCLAAIVALGLVAFAGSGAASATVLCLNNTTTEGCTAVVKKGDFLDMKVVANGLWTLKSVESGAVWDECKEGSTIRDWIEEPGGEKLRVWTTMEPGNYTWVNCSRSTKTAGGGKYEIEWIDKTDNGKLLVSGFEVWMEIPLGLGNCIWESGKEAEFGTIVGNKPATIQVKVELPLKTGSTACPKKVTMTAPYEFTEPNPLYVAKK